jgi:hypothetical protein
MSDQYKGSGAPGPREGRYANYFEVGHNAFEFVVDFAQLYMDGEKPRFHTRIITGPAYAKSMLEMLHQAIAQYEKSFGAIPTDNERSSEPQPRKLRDG